MKRNELLIEVAHFGEVLLEPTGYSNGRFGYMAVTEENGRTRSFNITLNPVDKKFDKEKDKGVMYLKLWGEAEVVCRHLLNKTDMFHKAKIEGIGLNYAQIVVLKPDYYEEKKK